MIEPISTTGRGPKRSDSVPQPMAASADARNPIVMAPDRPVLDQPVSCEMGTSKIGRENMAPMATQPIRPPAATITQRYEALVIPSVLSHFVVHLRGVQCR